MLGSEFHALFVCEGKRLPVLCISHGVDIVSFSLSRLCKQNKRGCVSGLETEGQIEEYKRVNVKLGKTKNINANPDCHNNSLGH